MILNSDIVVAQSEFVAAVCSLAKMKRSPRGGRAKIPSDTILHARDGRLIVDTPVMRTIVDMKGSWLVCISADAMRLAAVCAALKPAAEVQLRWLAGELTLANGAFTIPAFASLRPEA